MLRPLQHLLETIYDAPSGEDVEQFVVCARDALPAERRTAAADEELVLVQDGDEARLGLFIDADVLARLDRDSPLRRLSSANIADFWTVLEGVSHFNCVMWHAAHSKGVSQLELELQAEVDKYIASVWLLRAQNPGHFPRGLRRLLFERAHPDAGLDAPRRHLYAAASRYAARFCARLEQHLASDRPTLRRSAMTALRRFYRLAGTRKLHLIEALG